MKIFSLLFFSLFFLSAPQTFGQNLITSKTCPYKLEALSEFNFKLDEKNRFLHGDYPDISLDVLNLVQKSNEKQYFLNLYANALNDFSVKSLENMVISLGVKKTLTLLEIYQVPRKKNLLEKIFTSKGVNIKKHVPSLLSFVAKDPKRLEGFKILTGKKYNKNRILNSMGFLTLLKQDKNYSNQALSSFLYNIESSMTEAKLQGLVINQYNRSNFFKKIGFSFKEYFKKSFSLKESGEIVYLSKLKKEIISFILESDNDVNKVLKLKKNLLKKYPENLIDILILNSSKSNMIKNLQRFLDFSFKKKTIRVFSSVNWNDKMFKGFQTLRNDNFIKSFTVILRIVDNMVVSTSLKSSKIKMIFKDMIKDIMRNNNNIGTAQLFAELGAKSDKVSTKFQGAIFTYDYYKHMEKKFSGLKSLFKKFKLLGFEVPAYLIKSNESGAYSFLTETMKGDYPYYVLYKKRGTQLEFFEKDSVLFSKNTVSIPGVGEFTIDQKRKIDFAYKLGDKVYFAEMKNYSEDSYSLDNLDREWRFDLLFSSYFKDKSSYGIPWVVNDNYLSDNKKREEKLREIFISLSRYTTLKDFLNIAENLEIGFSEISATVGYYSQLNGIIRHKSKIKHTK